MPFCTSVLLLHLCKTQESCVTKLHTVEDVGSGAGGVKVDSFSEDH